MKTKKQLHIGPPRLYLDCIALQFPGEWLKGREFQRFRFGPLRVFKKGPVGRVVLADQWLKLFSKPAEATVWALIFLALSDVFEFEPKRRLLSFGCVMAMGIGFWEDVFECLSHQLSLAELVIAVDTPGIPYAGEFEIKHAFNMSTASSFYSRRDSRKYYRKEGSRRCGEAREGQYSFFSVLVVPPAKNPTGHGFKLKLSFLGKYRSQLNLSSLLWSHQDLITVMIPSTRRILNKLGVLGAWDVNPLATLLPGYPIGPFLSELGFLG